MYIIKNQFKEKFINLIFHTSCLFCYEGQSYVCHNCEEKFFEYFSPQNKLFLSETEKYDDTTTFEKTIICFRYNKALEYLLKQAKHKQYYEIAQFLGKILAKYIIQKPKFADLLLSNPTFIPIPLSKNKLNSRGFNQIDFLIKGLNDYLYKKYFIKINKLNLIKRIKNTQTQIGMNKAQRQKNLKSAFELDKNALKNFHTIKSAKNKPLIIIDDVFTTGTTIYQAIKTLQKHNFKNIYALIFAKG